MQIIYKPTDLLQAQMLYSMLIDEGIYARINGVNLLGGIGLLPVMDLLTLWAKDDQAELAKTLIYDYLSAEIDWSGEII